MPKAKELYENERSGMLSLVEATMAATIPRGLGIPPPADLSPKSGLGHMARTDKSHLILTIRALALLEEYGKVSRVIARALDSECNSCLGSMKFPNGIGVWGIYRWKDGRNTPDVHAVCRVRQCSGVYAAYAGDQTAETTRFMGSKGIIELTEFSLITLPRLALTSLPAITATDSRTD